MRVLLFIIFFAAIIFLYNSYLSANEGSDPCAIVKSQCPKPCKGIQNELNCYIPNFDCLSKKPLEPKLSCCISKCKDSAKSGFNENELKEFYRTFNFFGTKVNVNTSSLVGWVTLSVQAFLAVVSVVALLRGIKAGAFDLPRGDKLEEVKKDVRNTLLGFFLAWGAIFIIQVVLSVLGIPGLNELVIIGDQPGSKTGGTIVIK